MLRLVRVTHFIIFATITFLLGPGVGAAFGDWQADWDKTVAANSSSTFPSVPVVRADNDHRWIVNTPAWIVVPW